MNRGVKHVILILSGKGGVGKSTISVKLALGFKEKGYKVGLLDLDLCGPSIPFLLGIENSSVHQGQEGWVPVFTDKDQNLAVMSIGFLLNNRNESVIWRGPKKTSMIKQFLHDVYWQDIDFLIIDTPPGTSDEHITVVELVKDVCDGAILVTTPQNVSLDDVAREITFCQKTKIPIIGIIENMSGFVCPNCKDCTNIFSSGGGKALAEKRNIPYLGSLPIDPAINTSLKEFLKNMSESTTTSLHNIISTVVSSVVKE